jgi:hypothetical protein
MRVLQITKRCVTLLATACVALTGCGESGPDAPFNPSGTSGDLAALNATFESPTFASFSWFSPQFDAALGGSTLVSTSSGAFNFRRATTAGEYRAAAARTARNLAALVRKGPNESFSASSASIPSELAGKTFEYVDGSYVATARTGAPSNGVRFILYAVDPVTFTPVEPLVETGYVQLSDLSGGTTQAARVLVVSGTTTYLDYTVSFTATTTSGQVTVNGYVTDGALRANLLLRSTVTSAGGLTLLYRVTVPERDVLVNLTITAEGLDQEAASIEMSLTMSGPNGAVRLSGTFTQTGGTLSVSVNGEAYATITSTGAGEPTITGADGEQLTEEDVDAIHGVFDMTGEAFTSFDAMIMPVGVFMAPPA